MTGSELARILADAMSRWEMAADELTSLDRALGDGDLGLTVGAGARAVREAIAKSAESASPSDVLRSAARSFAAANPSTFSALAAAGVIAAAKELDGVSDVRSSEVLEALRSGARIIAERGGAKLGDKTVLDAVLPSVTALENNDGNVKMTLDAMASAARQGVEETTALISQRGRAAWIGERTVGHADGGATAYWRLIEALAAVWPLR